MKKILLSLLAVMISFTALAQTDGDKITINNSEGKQAEWNLTGETNTISSMKHNLSERSGRLRCFRNLRHQQD